VGQHAAVLEDQQRLHAARRLPAALLWGRPAQGLELGLAVDPRKLPTLLQHRLQQEEWQAGSIQMEGATLAWWQLSRHA
jgi:hypothetical protein